MSEFLITFVIALIATRFGVYFAYEYMHKRSKGLPAPNLLGIRIHHYHYGIALTLIAIAVKSEIVLGIGLALFVDELPFLLIGGDSHEDNYSAIANIGVIVFGTLVVLFSGQILELFL